MKAYMPICETMQIFYKSKGSHENQPCAKLPENLFSKNDFFNEKSAMRQTAGVCFLLSLFM